jgi:hypothetical protein
MIEEPVKEIWGKFSFDPNEVETEIIDTQQLCSCTHGIFQHYINEESNPINCKICACAQFTESN